MTAQVVWTPGAAGAGGGVGGGAEERKASVLVPLMGLLRVFTGELESWTAAHISAE